MQDPQQSVASKIFQQFDADKSGSLDEDELFQVFGELAKVNGKYLTAMEKQGYVRACLQQFGCSQGVTEAQFEQYVKTMPEYFNQLHVWRHLFEQYSQYDGPPHGRLMHPEHAVKLVDDLHRSNGSSALPT